MSDQLFIQIDEAITHQHQIIARARIEIARLEETRQVLASLGQREANGHTVSIGGLSFRKKAEAQIEHRPEPAKAKAKASKRGGQRSFRNRSDGKPTLVRRLLDFVTDNPGRTVAEIAAAFDAGHYKSQPYKAITAALRQLEKKHRAIGRDAEGRFSAGVKSVPKKATKPLTEQVIGLLKEAGEPLTVGEIKRRLGLHSTEHAASTTLSNLTMNGRVRKLGAVGKYRYEAADA